MSSAEQRIREFRDGVSRFPQRKFHKHINDLPRDEYIRGLMEGLDIALQMIEDERDEKHLFWFPYRNIVKNIFGGKS